MAKKNKSLVFGLYTPNESFKRRILKEKGLSWRPTYLTINGQKDVFLDPDMERLPMWQQVVDALNAARIKL